MMVETSDRKADCERSKKETVSLSFEKGENISVKCELLAFRQSVLHSEQI